MLTGRQIREARRLLGLSRIKFGRSVKITDFSVAAIESNDGPAWLTAEQEANIRDAFEAAGVEFSVDGSPRLRTAP